MVLGICHHQANQEVVEVLRELIFFNFVLTKGHGSVSVADSLNWHERAVSRCTEHFHESSFFVSFDDFMNRYFAFSYCNIKLFLNLFCYIDNCLSCHTVEDGAISRRSNELVGSVPALPESEDVHHSHFGNVVVKKP
jgi:hypothetical protein